MRSAPGWRVATGLAVVLPVALALVLLGGRSGAQWALAVDDAAQLAAAATAAATSAWCAHRSRGRGRLSWGLLAAACTSWAAGQGLWTYDQLVQGVAVPFPSWADAGLLGFPALALPALWARRAAGSGRAGVRSVLDGLMVAASALLISWVSVLQATWDAGAQSPFALAVSLAYPISDLVMVSVVVLTLGRARARTPLSLLAAGLVAMAVADSAFTYLTAAGTYQSASPTDAGWVAAFLFMACAGLHPQAPEGADARGARPVETGLAGRAGGSDEHPATASTRQAVLPHVLIAVGACALGVARGCGHRSEAALGIEAVAVAALLLRQLLTTVDNRRLAESTTAQQRQLHRLAFTDELTGLPNRRAVLQELTRALQRNDTLGVALVDLDRFKEVNDGLGHAAGDELLRQVTTRLLARGPLRSGLVRSVARLGGDEFLVLVVGPDEHLVAEMSADPRAAAAGWGQELLSRFQEPFELAGARVHVSVSVGLTVRRPVPGGHDAAGGALTAVGRGGPGGVDDGAAHASRATELLRQVDAAMYEAKGTRALGGARAVYDPARHDLATQRLLLVEQLRTAVRGDQLVLHYQPQVDVADGRVSAVEALVRWEHPERGLLGPDAFLGVAESHGLVGELTDVVLAQAVAQLAAWRAAPGGRDAVASSLRMAVNLSASSLLDDALPGRVAALLHHHGVPARLLVLEVTESVLLTDPERSTAVVAALVDLGVEVSIDDFGTGYSSLTQLQVLPARELKLDRSFTATVLTDPRTAAIVGATIGMAHVLGMRVVAEGVEDEVTLQALAALGCDTTQGYLHARPLPAAAVVGAVDRLHGGAPRARAGAAAT